jgi:NTP pyrophosphatase (non-canonical NTP hydrolase)
MADLPERPTLGDLQRYVADVCRERGWTDPPAVKFMLFVEEVGELAKAMRKAAGLYEEASRQRDLSLEEEFADALSYLLDLANSYQVDLEAAFRAKEQVNQGRSWR